MKVLLLFNSDLLAFPLLRELVVRDQLAGVGIFSKSKSQLLPGIRANGVADTDIAVFRSSSWKAQLRELIQSTSPNVVWVMGFPRIIPSEILELVPKGFVNFHFGELPKYKGADPLFWQIKNREERGVFTLHLMNDELDEGPIIFKEEFPMLPGENYGLLCQRLGQYTSQVHPRLIELMELAEWEFIRRTPTERVFDRKPSTEDFTINWAEQSAAEIEWLVNATNPKYGGAVTSLGGQEIRILEVSPADVEDEIEVEPGLVIYANALYGLVVACKDQQYIRITVVQQAAGYFSGSKLFQMGINTGQKFD